MSSLIVRPSQEVSTEVLNSNVKYTPFVNLVNSKSGKILDDNYAYMHNWINKLCLVKDGTYILIGNGSSFDARYVAMRNRATYYDEKDKSYSTVFSGVRTGDDYATYAKWVENAKLQVKGYKFGPEYLIFIPSMNEIATIYFGDNQGRAKAGVPIMNIVNDSETDEIGFTVYTEKFSGEKVQYPRMILKAKICNDPDLFAVEPDREDLERAVELFLNPPSFVNAGEENNER